MDEINLALIAANKTALETKWCRPEPKTDRLEVVIKPEALDTSVLADGEGNKTLYRPAEFNEYIGQIKAKRRLISRIEGAKKLNETMGHTLLTGSAGHGKTTLAYIIAKQLGLKVVELVGGSLKSEQQVVDKIAECEGGILFLDEIHKLSNKLGNFLLPIIEDFQVQGKKIKPFTLIAATTELGQLEKHLKPFVQRFPIQIELEDYNTEEIVTIIKQFHGKKYNDIKIDDHIYNTIALNCRLTPRIAISLLKDYICSENIKEVFENNQIVKDGFTLRDIKVLNYLNTKPMGASKVTISSFLGTSNSNYDSLIEPYLLKNDLIEISSRRKITIRGKEFLNEIKGKK